MKIEDVARKFALELHKNENRKGIEGANYYHDSRDPEDVKRQYITDGYIGVCYQNPIADAVEANLDYPVMMDGVINRARRELAVLNYFPTVIELKELLKTAKENGVKRSDAVVVVETGQCYNLQRLIRILELCGIKNDWRYDSVEIEDFRNGIMYLHRDDPELGEIDGLIMPMGRWLPSNVLKDYSKEES